MANLNIPMNVYKNGDADRYVELKREAQEMELKLKVMSRELAGEKGNFRELVRKYENYNLTSQKSTLWLINKCIVKLELLTDNCIIMNDEHKQVIHDINRITQRKSKEAKS